MQQNSRIRVHTSITPPEPEEKKPSGLKKRFARQNIRRRRLGRKMRAAQREKPKYTFSERLLRNTAVACALLLTILALSNIETPWSQKAVDGIRQALTMNVRLDERIGGMRFVERLMPESTLVFWNVGSGSPVPVDGVLSHEFSVQQPWQEYSLEGLEPVRIVMDGMVSAVGETAAGEWSVMVDHANGYKSVYAFMDEAGVRVGEELASGSVVGRASERLYFELRENGVSVNPEEKGLT